MNKILKEQKIKFKPFTNVGVRLKAAVIAGLAEIFLRLFRLVEAFGLVTLPLFNKSSELFKVLVLGVNFEVTIGGRLRKASRIDGLAETFL